MSPNHTGYNACSVKTYKYTSVRTFPPILQEHRERHQEFARGRVLPSLIDLLPQRQCAIFALVEVEWRPAEPMEEEKGKLWIS